MFAFPATAPGVSAAFVSTRTFVRSAEAASSKVLVRKDAVSGGSSGVVSHDAADLEPA